MWVSVINVLWSLFYWCFIMCSKCPPLLCKHTWMCKHTGHVNSKNNIFWGTTPPEGCLQRPLHSVKCTAWVAISKHGLIGPFWFEDENQRSVTVNTERYLGVIKKFWTALGRSRGVMRGSSAVPARWCNSSHIKCVTGMAATTLCWSSHQ